LSAQLGRLAVGQHAECEKRVDRRDVVDLVGVTGYMLNGIMAAYPEYADLIRSKLTPRGAAMLDSTSRQCVGQTQLDFAFRHLQPYFYEDLNQLATRSRSAAGSNCSASGATNPTRQC